MVEGEKKSNLHLIFGGGNLGNMAEIKKQTITSDDPT